MSRVRIPTKPKTENEVQESSVEETTMEVPGTVRELALDILKIISEKEAPRDDLYSLQAFTNKLFIEFPEQRQVYFQQLVDILNSTCNATPQEWLVEAKTLVVAFAKAHGITA